MATSEGIPSSIDIELLELNDNPYDKHHKDFLSVTASEKNKMFVEQIKEAIKRAL